MFMLVRGKRDQLISSGKNKQLLYLNFVFCVGELLLPPFVLLFVMGGSVKHWVVWLFL